MNYHNIKHDDMLNGEGLRVTLFVSGCENHCHGCQNPQTWDPSSGIPFDTEAMIEILTYLSKDYTCGLTLSGGDPLYRGNLETTTGICAICKSIAPEKNIWLYSGYTWDAVKGLPIMKYVDVMVDGPYIESQRNVKMRWAGSTNQRVIDVQQTLQQGHVVLYQKEKSI